jgi:hypothetical protein
MPEVADADRPVQLAFGDTGLSQAYLGVVIGRHPALCERVIDYPSVSRRRADSMSRTSTHSTLLW